jgi:hypothetical protein
MTHDLDKIEAALAHASEKGRDLTPDERAALRELLEWWRTWKAWGKLGKIVLWAMITAGAIAAAIRELRATQWFGS